MAEAASRSLRSVTAVPALSTLVLLFSMPVLARRTEADTVHVAGHTLVVHRYQPAGVPRCPSVVLLSGDGGWALGVVSWAEAMAADGHEVVGVDARRLVAVAGADGLAGVIATWPEVVSPLG